MKVISKMISKLISPVRPKFFAAVIIVSLIITTALFYILRGQEKSLRLFTEEQLSLTVKEKSRVEGELRQTIIAKKNVEKAFEREKVPKGSTPFFLTYNCLPDIGVPKGSTPFFLTYNCLPDIISVCQDKNE